MEQITKEQYEFALAKMEELLPLVYDNTPAIGISPSRINDYISGRSEPTLRVARLLCTVPNISPAAMLWV